jgi:putative ABC transport system permease protein
MTMLLLDVRYALRGLVRAPGFAAIVLITVAIGTGANAAVFSFIDAMLLRPATGVADPARLVTVYTADFSAGPYGVSSYPDFRAMADDTGTFASLAAYESNAAVMVAEGSAERVQVASVTGWFFEVAGLRAAKGRLLAEADTQPSASRVAVISDRLWRQSFRGDAGILGSVITIGSKAFTIVGVAPPGFDALNLSQSADAWTPFLAPPEDPMERDRRRLAVIGRLAPGITLEQAQTRLSGLAHRLGELYPKTNLGTLQKPADARAMTVVWHTRLGAAFRRDVADLGGVLLAATLLVLLIACANVAGLLLARATSRRREMAVRLALGASRARLVRQLLTESLVIGVAGGALGLLVALWMIRALPAFFPPDIARLIDFRIDAPVILFALTLAIVASLIFGLAPALQTRHWSQAFSTRSEDTGAEVPGVRRARQMLVVVQVALSCVLLVATGLLAQTASNLAHADPGFTTRNGLIASVDLPSTTDVAKGREIYQQLRTRLQKLPGVESVTLASTLPLTRSSRRGFEIAGYQPAPGEGRELNFNIVDTDYFETLGIAVRSGRTFESTDRAESTPVVVVNDVFAKRYFNGEAVGKRIVDSHKTELEIVGVVQSGPYLTVGDPAVPFVYYPLWQAFDPSVNLIARVGVDPESLRESLRREIAARQDAAVYGITTLESQVAQAATSERLSATLVSVCGLLATILASVGVYGVMAYAVVRRAREIGVRVALGARPRQVLQLITREGILLAVAGVGVGLLGALQGVTVLQSMRLLYGVSASDLVSFTGAPLLLGAMVVLASVVPIRRALRVDPMVVLRQD